jgi:hypothetical protein
METKKCFKCGKMLPLSDFYKHKQMRDGHLNKCKSCTKTDVRLKYEENIINPEYIEKERLRCRLKYAKYKYKYKNKSKIGNFGNTHKFLKNKGYDMSNKEAHHWNYNFKNNVFILNRRSHGVIHKYLIFDEATNLFKYNGVLIDSAEKHFNIILEILKSRNRNINIIYVDM